MRSKNLQFVSILTAVLFLFTSGRSFSQWTIAGSVNNPGTTPSVSVVDQNTVWVAGGTAPTPSVSRTTNGGTTWTVIPTNGIPIELYCIWATDVNTAYVGDGGLSGGAGGNAKVYKTTNAGLNWNVVVSTGGTLGFINGIVFSKTTPLFGIAQSDPPNGAGQPYFISVTTDGGINWTATSPPGYAGMASAQNSIVVINNLFYGFGTNASPPAFVVTTDGGTTWNKRNSSVTGTFTSGLAFKDGLTGILASSTSLPTISRTTDAGVTWTSISTATTIGGYCTMKWIDGTNTCYLSGATGSSGAISKSTNGGLNWTTQTTSGLTGVTHMEFYRNGANVYGYAATANGAMLKIAETVTGINVNTVNSLIPNEFKLEQNFPNPFNPSTTINFSLPASTNVSLKVYDALGKEVATLVNEFRPAGNYSTNFTETSGLTSGIYFYTIRAGEFVSTKKLMLVK